ncbi:MAG: HEAT repeat domain-containing protein [Candidatus Brocadiia bacterium]
MKKYRLVIWAGCLITAAGMLVSCDKEKQAREPVKQEVIQQSAPVEPILGPVELTYLRDALRCIKMTPQDLLYKKNTDPGMPYRLKAIDRLMANPLDVPFYTDDLARKLSSPNQRLETFVTSMVKEIDMDFDVPVFAQRLTDEQAYSLMVMKGTNKYEQVKNLPADIKAPVSALLGYMSKTSDEFKRIFANLSDEGKKNLQEHGDSFDVYQEYESISQTYLMGASIFMAGAVDVTIPKFKSIKPVVGVSPQEFSLDDSKVKGNILFYANTEVGEVIVGGSGPNEYHADFSLIIDLGGDDLYTCRAGGTDGRTQPPVAVCIDLGGNNRFIARMSAEGGSASGGKENQPKDESDKLEPGNDRIAFCQGSALAGIGILVVDGDGNNTFTAGDWSQGAAHLGVGVLLRTGKGNDTYKGLDTCQGAASFGIGALIDDSGDDKYSATFGAQGFGGPAGIGLVLDRSGNDNYYAGGRYEDYPQRPRGSFIAMSQGFGYGIRPGCSGGIGILLDNAGDDSYFLDNQFGLGGSYWFGLGILVDDAGNDTYKTGVNPPKLTEEQAKKAAEKKEYLGGDYDGYTMGAAIHLAAACMIDRTGDDKYYGHKIGPAVGWDFSPAWLIDGGGTDLFNTSRDWNRLAAGNQNGCGFLLKKSGSARFEGYSVPSSYADRDCGGIGILLNLGKGEYDTVMPKQMTPGAWYSGRSFDNATSWCAGIDGPVFEKEREKMPESLLANWPRREFPPVIKPAEDKKAATEEVPPVLPNIHTAELTAIRARSAEYGDGDQEVIKQLDVLSATDPAEPEIIYEQATFWAPMDPAKALGCLSQAAQNGYANAAMLRDDNRLSNIKSLPGYKAVEEQVKVNTLTPEEMDKLWQECVKEQGAHWDKSSVARDRFRKLGRPGLYYAIPKLITSDSYAYQWASDFITGQGKAAVPVLMNCLKSANEPLRNTAMALLGQIGDQRATEAIIPLLQNKDIVNNVCRVLGTLKDPKAVPAMLEVVKLKDFSENEWMRKNFAVALGRIGDARAVTELVKLLDDPYFWVRYPAELSLIQIGEPSVKPLLEVVKQNKFPASAHAIEALGRINDIVAINEELTNQLSNKDWAMRGFAVEAAGELMYARIDTMRNGGMKSIQSGLLSRLYKMKETETHPFVKGKIAWAIERINNPPKKEEKK